MGIFFYIVLLIFLILLIIYLTYAFIFHRGAVYYPSTAQAARKMLELAKARKKDVVIDFGSGDGVILFEAAKKGIKAIGYEIDPLLVKKSREKAKRMGLSDLVEVRMSSMYNADFNEGTVLLFYQFPNYLKRFEKLLDKKLNKKVRVVSNRYKFPNKKIWKSEGKIYLYRFGN